MNSGRTLARVAVLSILWSSVAAFAIAAPAVTLSPNSGHPRITTDVRGSGFVANEAVDIYFDATDMILDVTDSSGNFGPDKLTVPANALPGAHWITAIGRRDGDAAHKAFTVTTSWAEVGFTERGRRNNPYENVIDSSDVNTLDVSWIVGTGGKISSSPAVANGLAYFGSDDGKLYAIVASTGATKWTATTGSAVRPSPAVAKGVVYDGSLDGKLYAWDAKTGAVKWINTLGMVSLNSSPAVANGVVYIGSIGDTLYAVDAATGTTKWAAATGSSIRSSPAVANGVVYVGSDDDKLYAFNAETGATLWMAVTGDTVVSSPAEIGRAHV